MRPVTPRFSRACCMVMLALVLSISLIPLVQIAPAQAYSVDAVNGYPSSIQDAVDDALAHGGGTVHIPAGTWNWGNGYSSVTIESGGDLIITGASPSGCSGHPDYNLYTATTILNAGTQPQNAMFILDVSTDDQITVMNLQFQCSIVGSDDLEGANAVEVSDAIDFHIHHCTFLNFPNAAIESFGGGNARGVIDHIFIDNPYKDTVGGNWAYGIIISSTDYESWDSDITHFLGKYDTANATFPNVYIEDNLFSRCRHAVASNQRGWYVVRYNYVHEERPTNFGLIDVHGSSPTAAGGRGLEAYNNFLDLENEAGSVGFVMRGGSGLIYNNTILNGISGVRILKDQEGTPLRPLNDLWIWNNNCTNIDEEVENYDAYYVENVDYFLYEYDGGAYIPFEYPHPLASQNLGVGAEFMGFSGYPESLGDVQDIIDELEANGLNLYRMSFNPSWASSQPHPYTPAYIEYFLNHSEASLIIDRNHLYPPNSASASGFVSHITTARNDLLATLSQFGSNPKVMIELVNEYTGSDWRVRNQYLLDAVRGAGYTNKVVANKWETNWASSILTDPLDKTYYGMHFYFNSWSVNGALSQMQIAVNLGLNVINTEVGADYGEGSEFSQAEVTELQDFLNGSYQMGMGSCVWMNAGLDNWVYYEGMSEPLVIPAPLIPTSPPSGEPVFTTLIEYYETGGDYILANGGAIMFNAQTFTPQSNYNVTMISLYLQRVGSPVGDLDLYLLGTNATGNPLKSVEYASASINGDDVPLTWTWINFTLTPSVILNASTTYAIEIEALDANPNEIEIEWRADGTDPEYGGGAWYLGTGDTWGIFMDEDLFFRVYGIPTMGLPIIEAFESGLSQWADSSVSISPVHHGGSSGALFLADSMGSGYAMLENYTAIGLSSPYVYTSFWIKFTQLDYVSDIATTPDVIEVVLVSESSGIMSIAIGNNTGAIEWVLIDIGTTTIYPTDIEVTMNTWTHVSTTSFIDPVNGFMELTIDEVSVENVTDLNLGLPNVINGIVFALWNNDPAFTSSNTLYLDDVKVSNIPIQFEVEILPDILPPTYANPTVSTNTAGAISQFVLTIDDDVEGVNYIFSSNASGIWTNQTERLITSTPQNVTSSLVLPTMNNTIVDYCWYLEDLSGNVNQTGIQSLTTLRLGWGEPPGGTEGITSGSIPFLMTGLLPIMGLIFFVGAGLTFASSRRECYEERRKLYEG